MQKRNFILSTILIFSLLLVGIYVYADENSLNNPGHSWDEMDCDTQMCVGANVGVGTASPGYKLHVSGTSYVSSNFYAPIMYDANNTDYYLNPNSGSQISTIYANNWFRAQGNTGLYFQDYGGGWYMTDSTWVRAYNSKPVYSPGEIRSGSLLRAPAFTDLDSSSFSVNPYGSSRLWHAVIGSSDSVGNDQLRVNNGTSGWNAIVATNTSPNTSAIYSTASCQYGTCYAGYFNAGTNGRPLVAVGMPAGSGLAGVLTDSNGVFYWNSSSAKYKKNIQPFKDDFYKIFNVKPKSFISKESNTPDIGYIAEEFEKAGLKDLIIYRNGQPESIKYDKMPLYLIEIVKDQQERIEELERKVDANKNLNSNQQSFWKRISGVLK